MNSTAGHMARRRNGTRPRAARPRVALLLALVAMWSLAAGLVVATLLALSAAPVLADDGSVFAAGGAVHPMANSDIRMESETVQAVCFSGFAEYRAEFHFVNSGEPRTVQLGFPFTDYSKRFEGQPSLVAFRAWQDGAELRVTVGTGDDPAWPGSEITYYLHQATFPRGESVVTVSYLVDLNASASPRFSDDAPASLGPPGMAASFDYWLHSGAGWSGTIGKAVIRFNLADTFPGWALVVKQADTTGYEAVSLTTKPESYVALDDRTYQWVFEDLEPTTKDDVVLAFTLDESRYNDRDAGSWVYPDVTAIEGSGRADLPMAWMPAGWEAFDGSAKASWGAPAPGVGSWTKISFAKAHSVREIRILPGRNENPESFEEYGRPRTLRVTCSDGTDTVLHLKDEPSLQRFRVSAEATWVRFDTLAIYPGIVDDDTYISEIELGSEPAPEFEGFSDLILATAPPGEPFEAPSTTIATASTGPVQASTTASAVTTALSAATSSTTTSPTPSTVTTSAVGTADTADTLHRGWLWPAYIAIGVAVVALVTLVTLERRTRAKAKR
jgi:hypothetical protein